MVQESFSAKCKQIYWQSKCTNYFLIHFFFSLTIKINIFFLNFVAIARILLITIAITNHQDVKNCTVAFVFPMDRLVPRTSSIFVESFDRNFEPIVSSVVSHFKKIRHIFQGLSLVQGYVRMGLKVFIHPAGQKTRFFVKLNEIPLN